MATQSKQRLFIYERKEVVVLSLLGLMVAAFAFTLGVHLGKKVAFEPTLSPSAETHSVQSAPDQVPNRLELNDQGKGIKQAVDETLNQELHDEVERAGIRLETSRQVDLPNHTRAKNAGATTLHSAAERMAPAGKYTLQIGSYPSLDEARGQVEELEGKSLKPFLRSAQVKGKGTWYRVYVGGYASRESAEKAGHGLRAQSVIESFLVARISE